MDIQYVANARLPSRKAHTHQIVQMCDGFVEGNNNVELVAPVRRQPSDGIKISPQEYYDTDFNFECTFLPCIDFIWLIPILPDVFGRPVFLLQHLSFSIIALFYSFISDVDATYTRSRPFAALAAPLLQHPVVLEIHRGPPNRFIRNLLTPGFGHLEAVVTISDGLRDDWKSIINTSILVLPDAVDISRFEISEKKEDLRESLMLPSDRYIATYVGSFRPWKGVDTLTIAAQFLDDDIHVCIVGAQEGQKNWLHESVGTIPEQVQIVEHTNPRDVPLYMKASDVLVLPNTSDSDISARYTSPLKMFEYMAAKRPIVASDLPSLREILDESCAYFFSPDNPSALATAIEATRHDGNANKRAAHAKERVDENYTWERRADRITDVFDEGIRL